MEYNPLVHDPIPAKIFEDIAKCSHSSVATSIAGCQGSPTLALANSIPLWGVVMVTVALYERGCLLEKAMT